MVDRIATTKRKDRWYFEGDRLFHLEGMMAMTRRAYLVLTIICVLLGGGIAYAAIPDSAGSATPGRIHGCYRTSNPAKGALIVIDAEAGQSCPSGYATLNWGPPVLGVETFDLTLTGEQQTWDVHCSDRTDSVTSYTAVTMTGSSSFVDQSTLYGTDFLQTNIGARQWNDGIRFYISRSTAGATFHVALACLDNIENF